MQIPTGAIIPPLLVAFLVLAVEYYRVNPEHPVANIRFLMMIAAVLMMFAQLMFGRVVPWLSVVLFALALVWLGVAAVLARLRMRAG